jgi:hypothetical protein
MKHNQVAEGDSVEGEVAAGSPEMVRESNLAEVGGHSSVAAMGQAGVDTVVAGEAGHDNPEEVERLVGCKVVAD